ncbi:MAG: tetratricopeptide repeat protein [Planctomycetes bacterium]|nr:tetratricopeptide repeat protein [Planctomycetota bacterium]
MSRHKQPPHQEPPTQSREHRLPTGVVALFLVALTVLAYWQTFDNGFAFFDDDGYVVENPAVRQGLTGPSLKYAWTTFDLGNWIPLTWMSYELDVSLWGLRPLAFHAVDLALHAISVLLLFYLMLTCSGARGRSAIVAAFWAVHPLHVESVAWIAERKDVLSTVFLLLALICYARYASRLQRRWYIATVVAFVLGMLSKPMLVTLPVLLLAFDLWPLRRGPITSQQSTETKFPTQTLRRLLLEKLPLLAVSAVFAVIMLAAQRSHAALVSIEAAPLSLRLGNVLDSYVWYLFKTLVPTDLSPFYPLWSEPISGRAWLVGLAVIGGLSYWVLRGWRTRPWLASGWLWFLVSLLPVIGLVQLGGAAHADRYSYVPHLGLLALLVWELQHWFDYLPRGRAVGALLATVLLLFCTMLTSLQVEYWYLPQSLWHHALHVDSQNWMAHMHLGRDSLRRNDAQTAVAHFQSTIQLHPGYTDAYLMLAALYQHQKQWELAEKHYLAALQVDPQNFVALLNLGIICRQTDRIPDARDYLQRCLTIDPQAPRALAELKLLDSPE